MVPLLQCGGGMRGMKSLCSDDGLIVAGLVTFVGALAISGWVGHRGKSYIAIVRQSSTYE